MALKRIMPCLLFDGKSLVKTVNFKKPNYIGDPINAIKIYNDKEVDELVLLDITATKENRKIDFNKIEKFAAESFMPFSYGGGVKTLDDFKNLYSVGIEKVIVNSVLFTDPDVVKRATDIFGSQSVVASLDVKTSFWGKYEVFSYSGRTSRKEILAFCDYLQDEIKVGEILVTSVDNEGTWKGYDFKLIKKINQHVSIPVIANGGAGSIEDIKNVLYESDVNAAALGSMAVYQKKGMGVLIGFPKREKVILDE